MTQRLSLFLDLGDAFTKSLSLGGARPGHFRYPSVVASRLLSGGAEMAELSLDGGVTIPRPVAFAPEQFPRTRSYPASDDFVARVRAEPPARGARFAGRIAAMYGADRRLLGRAPSAEAVDALVHKALILSGLRDRAEADVTFVVDQGAKAATVGLWAAAPRTASLELHSYNRRTPRRVRVHVRGRIVDAPDCLLEALPPELRPTADGALLLLDVGFFRTKLAVVSVEGCELRNEIHSLGISEVVQRVLRDGQEHGLVEDEFAVIGALEARNRGEITVAGRRFDVARPMASALGALEQELERAVEGAILEHFRRSGQPCRTLAVVGGGAVLAGPGLERRVKRAGHGLGAVWVAQEPSFLLVEGARALSAPVEAARAAK